jgi:hypothetical protein
VPQYDEIEVKWQRTLDKWYLTQNKPISATLPSPGSASYTMELFDKKVKYRDRPIDEAMVEMLTAFAAHIALRRGFKCWDRHAESLKRVALRLRFASREWRCRAFLAPMQKWRSRAFVWRAKARARSYGGALRMLRLCRRWLRRARVCKRRLHLQAKVSTHALKWWRLQARRTMDALAANATRRKFVRLSHHLCERQQQSARRCALHGALGEWRAAALAADGRSRPAAACMSSVVRIATPVAASASSRLASLYSDELNMLSYVVTISLNKFNISIGLPPICLVISLV